MFLKVADIWTIVTEATPEAPDARMKVDGATTTPAWSDSPEPVARTVVLAEPKRPSSMTLGSATPLKAGDRGDGPKT